MIIKINIGIIRRSFKPKLIRLIVNVLSNGNNCHLFLSLRQKITKSVGWFWWCNR